MANDLDGKTLARLGGIVFVAVVVSATAIELNRKDTPPLDRHLVPEGAPPAVIRHEDLRRCQRMGEAARADAGCLRVWADNRERFLGTDETPPMPVSSTPDAMSEN